MIRFTRKMVPISARSVASVLTTVLMGMAATAWGTSTKSVSWTVKDDFETNASTTGTPTTRLNIDTTKSLEDLRIGVTKDFTTTATITCVTADSIYTTAIDRTSIAVLDLTTKAVKSRIPLPSRAAGVLYNPLNNRVYVGLYDTNSVVVIDAALNPPAIVATLPSGGTAGSGAYAAAFNPTNKKLYVANTGDQTVSIFDAEHDDLPPKIVPVVAGATTATFDAANDKMYFTSKANQYVTVIDGVLDTVENLQVDEVLNLLGGQAPGSVGLRVDAPAKGIVAADEMKLSWDYQCNGPNERIMFQVRTADDVQSLDLAQYKGPGTQDAAETWYESVCTAAASTTQTATVSLGKLYKPAAEVQVKLSSDGLSTPVVNEVRLQYDSYPDLTLSDLSASPATVNPGGTITVSTNVRNIGAGAADSSKLGIYLFGNGTFYYLGDTSISAMEAGALLPVTATATVPVSVPAGTYSVQLCADYQEQLTESNEGNNCITGGSVTVANLPDYVISSVGPLRNGGAQPVTTAATGQRLSLWGTTKNQGLMGGASSKFAVFLKNSQTSTKVGDNTVFALKAGASFSQWSYADVPLNLPVGVYDVQVCADSDGTVLEKDESNNCTMGSPVTVYDSRDLVAKGMTVPANVVVGQPVTVQVTVENHANLAVPDYNIGLYVADAGLVEEDSTMPITWTYIGSARVTGLAAGATSTYNVTVTWPQLYNAQYYFNAFVDYDSKIVESDEFNNQAYSATSTAATF